MHQRNIGCAVILVLLGLGLVYGLASSAGEAVYDRLSGHSPTATPSTPPLTQDALSTCLRDTGVYDAWPDTIRAIHIDGNAITLDTALFSKDSNKQDARTIGTYALTCAGNAGHREMSVSVRASNGDYLLSLLEFSQK